MSTRCRCERQSTERQFGSALTPYSSSARRAAHGLAGTAFDASSLGITTYRTQFMVRIALDIDSTLHHYWDLLDRISRERFGVPLLYASQRDWNVTALPREQLIACVQETHTDENIAAGEPYPGAVGT